MSAVLVLEVVILTITHPVELIRFLMPSVPPRIVTDDLQKLSGPPARNVQVFFRYPVQVGSHPPSASVDRVRQRYFAYLSMVWRWTTSRTIELKE